MQLLGSMSRVSLFPVVAVLLVAVAACTQPSGDVPDASTLEAETSGGAEPEQPPEAMSLLGAPLMQLAPSDAVRAEFEQNLALAEAVWAANPRSADALIWVGRRTAYLGHYQAAIELFGTGVQQFPRDPRFLRHRGHRLISTRQLDRAIEDLAAAYAMIEGTEDEVEPDGLPNAAGIPTSTLHSNIRYHLGLAHYLKGDFASALPLYEEDVERATNPDMRTASTYWLYLTQRRLGEEAAARRVLANLDPELELIENFDYHRLLLYFAGQAERTELLGQSEDGEALPSLASATRSYGVATFDLLEGRREQAKELYERIVDGPQWSAFGYLAAEAELARWAESD